MAAILPAAGHGRRLKSKTPKPFVLMNGKPLFIHTLLALKKSYPFYEFILAVNPDRLYSVRQSLRRFGMKKAQAVAGGKTRAESVKNALMAVSDRCEWVLVHDAARPLVSRDLVRRTLEGARSTGAAIAALPARATVKRVEQKKQMIEATEDRETLYLAQTPQVFRRKLFLTRYQTLGRSAFNKTDDAALFDGTKTRVKAVLGEVKNIKITTPEDLDLFKFYHNVSLRAKRSNLN